MVDEKLLLEEAGRLAADSKSHTAVLSSIESPITVDLLGQNGTGTVKGLLVGTSFDASRAVARL